MARAGWATRPGIALLALLPLSCSPAPQTAIADSTPTRVAVLAPAAAEMLEALELLDRVVGIGEFGPWPASIAGLPVVGGYASPNVEQLLQLDCDALLTTDSRSADAAHARLEALGIDVLALDTSTHEGVFDSLETLGTRFGRQMAAAELALDLRTRLDALRGRGAGLEKRRVLFVVGRDPLFVAGPGSHVDEMIAAVGGVNVAHDALSPYQQFSLETALERMPEIIVDTSDNRPGAPRGRVAGRWGEWGFVPAVQEDRVYHVEPGKLVIPGIRLPEMTGLMGRLVHPETFGSAADEELGP
ncbi:MAG: ABC transporter substrate-binding protein [bacterium]|nr:ABC transporter substrate-binding protein [bacterium]